MSIPRPTLIAAFRTVLLAGLLAMAPALSAAEAGFSGTLSAEQLAATGLTSLTPAELVALDRLVALDQISTTGIAKVLKENPPELSDDFVARRKTEELKQTGLDRLTPAQLSQLNALIAATVATNPKPKDRPRIKDSEVFSARRKPEVHGGFSLTYGQGSGGSNFRAASMWVDYFDPNSGLGLSFGITRSKGSGIFGYWPGYYGSSPFYHEGLGYFGSPYRGFSGENWFEGDELTLGASLELNRDTYRDFRRR